MSPFLEQLQAYIDARRAAGESIVLLLVDCGVVGQLDANWGYQVGDAAHDFFEARMRVEALREQDFIVAIGRDEFACVLTAVVDADVALLAAEKVLRALDTAVWVGEDEVYASAAVGIAMPAAPDEDAATLLGNARAACSVARERTGRAVVFSPADCSLEPVRLLVQGRLRAAMLQEAVEFLFRPQREVRGGMLVGAEGVLSWPGGVVPVSEAIAAVRDARRVNEATQWAARAILHHGVDLRQGCGMDLRVGFNISARDLQLRETAESILSLMKVWNLRPSRLLLGIADAGVLVHRPEGRELLQALAGAGVRLRFDDAATGLAGLAQLEGLPFTELRLDIAALGDPAVSATSRGIARGLIEAAHQLRLEVLADGVASAATVDCLKDLGCDIMQGDHVGPLLTAQRFVEVHRQ